LFGEKWQDLITVNTLLALLKAFHRGKAAQFGNLELTAPVAENVVPHRN